VIFPFQVYTMSSSFCQFIKEYKPYLCLLIKCNCDYSTPFFVKFVSLENSRILVCIYHVYCNKSKSLLMTGYFMKCFNVFILVGKRDLNLCAEVHFFLYKILYAMHIYFFIFFFRSLCTFEF